MNFNKIDMETWNRKTSYNHYLNLVPCTYSMTVNIDITKFIYTTKRNDIKFFPCVLYGITNIVNNHKEFRMDMDENKNIGYYDISNPCFTVFHNENEMITNVWTQYDSNFDIFIENYNNDMLEYKNDFINSKPLNNKNCFNVSCIPWTSFTGFNLNLQKGYDYFPPIFTIGKYFKADDKIQLPLAIQVHHAVCDGYHLSRFVYELQQWVDNFENN